MNADRHNAPSQEIQSLLKQSADQISGEKPLPDRCRALNERVAAAIRRATVADARAAMKLAELDCRLAEL